MNGATLVRRVTTATPRLTNAAPEDLEDRVAPAPVLSTVFIPQNLWNDMVNKCGQNGSQLVSITAQCAHAGSVKLSPTKL